MTSSSTMTSNTMASNRMASNRMASKTIYSNTIFSYTNGKYTTVADIVTSKMVVSDARLRSRDMVAPKFFTYPVEQILGKAPVYKTPCDLNNEIHPIFRQHQWAGSIDFEALEPALRLASLFLTTDCLLGYWRLLMEGIHVEVGGKDGFLDHFKVYGNDLKQPVPARQVAEVKLALVKLADLVRFFPGDGMCCQAQESTVEDGWIAAIDSQGLRSHIEYDEAVYLDIKDHFRQTCESETCKSGRGFPHCLLNLYFQFAVSMLHEVAHAFRNARYWYYGHTTYIGNNKMSEDGFNFENFLFGGVPWIEHEGAICADWPGSVTACNYLCNGYAIFNPVKKMKAITCEWRVPISYVAQLFQTSFWQTRVASEGADALKIPRILGYRAIPGYVWCDPKHCKTGTIIGLPNRRQPSARFRSTECVCDREFAYTTYSGSPNYEGVPDGFEVLDDGSIVLKKFANQVKSWRPDLSCSSVDPDSWARYVYSSFDSTIPDEALCRGLGVAYRDPKNWESTGQKGRKREGH